MYRNHNVMILKKAEKILLSKNLSLIKDAELYYCHIRYRKRRKLKLKVNNQFKK